MIIWNSVFQFFSLKEVSSTSTVGSIVRLHVRRLGVYRFPNRNTSTITCVTLTALDHTMARPSEANVSNIPLQRHESTCCPPRNKKIQKRIQDHLRVILRPPQKSHRSVSSHPLVSHSAFCPANDGAMRLCSLSGLRHGTYDHDIGEMKHHFFRRRFLGLRYRILCRCSELYCFEHKMLRKSTEHSDALPVSVQTNQLRNLIWFLPYESILPKNHQFFWFSPNILENKET